MRSILGIVVALVSFINLAQAHGADLSAAQKQRLSAESGVITTTSMEGPSIVTTWKKNGVTITRKQNGSDVTVIGNDASRGGAVICYRGLYMLYRGALEACPAAGDAEIKQELDHDLQAIDAFIVQNSMDATTADDLRKDEEKQLSATAKALQDKQHADMAAVCNADGPGGNAVAYIKGQSASQRKDALDNLLSVPR